MYMVHHSVTERERRSLTHGPLCPRSQVSMGVPAAGSDYGIDQGLYFSVPVVCYPDGEYRRIGGVSMTADVAAACEKSRVALAAAAK